MAHLCSQIRNDDELLQHILGQNVSEPRFLDIIGRYVNMIGSQVEIRRRYCSHSPLGFRRERVALVITRRRHDDFVAVNVRRFGRGCCQLRLILRLLLDFSDLLSLLRRSGDLHTKDDVSNFRLSEGSYVDTKMEECTVY